MSVLEGLRRVADSSLSLVLTDTLSPKLSPKTVGDYCPVPVSATACGDAVALSVMVKAAEAAPVTCG